MQSLQEKAAEWSGVDAEDAFAIDGTNLYEKLGLQTFISLSTNFYERSQTRDSFFSTFVSGIYFAN